MHPLVDDTVVTSILLPAIIKSFAITGTLAMGVVLHMVKLPLSISNRQIRLRKRDNPLIITNISNICTLTNLAWQPMLTFKLAEVFLSL